MTTLFGTLLIKYKASFDNHLDYIQILLLFCFAGYKVIILVVLTFLRHCIWHFIKVFKFWNIHKNHPKFPENQKLLLLWEITKQIHFKSFNSRNKLYLIPAYSLISFLRWSYSYTSDYDKWWFYANFFTFCLVFLHSFSVFSPFIHSCCSWACEALKAIQAIVLYLYMIVTKHVRTNPFNAI